MPVVDEQLQVGRRQVQRGGVRLYTRITERPVEETVRLRNESITVERQLVDRPAREADFAAAKEGAIEVTETDEEAVVSKQVRVVEEVVVSKEVTERTETVRDTARRTEVEVEPLGAERARESQGFDLWAPAYRYGYELARHRRYADRDWTMIEAEARRDWEARHQGTWDEVQETIRYAWDKVHGQR